ncbi:MAG: MCE family protein [Candidatus Cloacimonetes bacterium]|nr:MCE family protein [Candidatus Cloacimonadota bacterium]MBS3767009.1 MCE family protein [Candidatus Cloacimonadota bacterium]
MKSKKYEISVGIVVVIAVIAIIVGSILFSEKQHRSGYYEIIVDFPRVGGLEVGSNVYVNGVNSGNVELIKLNKNYVNVVISLAKDVKLASSAEIFVQESGLMGEREIHIKQGNSKTLLDVNKNLKGYYQPGIHETTANIYQLVEEVKLIASALSEQDVEKISKNLSKLDQLLTNLNNIFRDQGKIHSILKKSDMMLTSFDSLVTDNSRDIKEVISKADRQINQLDLLLKNLNKLTAQLNKPDTDFGKFTTQDSVYNKLNATMSNLDSLITDIKKNPGRYFSIF